MEILPRVIGLKRRKSRVNIYRCLNSFHAMVLLPVVDTAIEALKLNRVNRYAPRCSNSNVLSLFFGALHSSRLLKIALSFIRCQDTYTCHLLANHWSSYSYYFISYVVAVQRPLCCRTCQTRKLLC